MHLTPIIATLIVAALAVVTAPFWVRWIASVDAETGLPIDPMAEESGDIPHVPPTFRDSTITDFHDSQITAPPSTRQRESAGEIPARKTP